MTISAAIHILRDNNYCYSVHTMNGVVTRLEVECSPILVEDIEALGLEVYTMQKRVYVKVEDEVAALKQKIKDEEADTKRLLKETCRLMRKIIRDLEKFKK